ncbi:putative Low choriolytic enzyme [Hypsibius exemplaris]|uniref:Metalloendopeptidase n=1 Tax=Hypsibius exemplaris TaxID=2072580 RepID=A0A1W0WMN4_HYPEX|nr:putative Low choriolytic enzyme [Hypsibius exemplaris]
MNASMFAVLFLALFLLLDHGLGVSARKWDTISSLWPNAVVPYKVSKSVKNVDSKGILRQTMDEIEAVSCIKFVPRKDERDFLDISAGFDCSTVTGHRGQAQVLVLQIPFCLERRKLLRQLLHTLGLPNEQLRPDRDDHVKINWGNINPLDATLFFTKLNTTDLPLSELPYDYNSILHADANYRALKPTEPTIIPLEAGTTVGKATGLSALDIAKLNVLYC